MSADELAPCTIALVDVDADEHFLELVKSALLAALEALPPSSKFGLITFSHKVRFATALLLSRRQPRPHHTVLRSYSSNAR